MSNFFLMNETIEDIDFNNFLHGMSVLNAIDRNEEHFFKKHTSIYDLANYSKLFDNHGQIEQLIVVFIEQLMLCENYINSEDLANSICESDINGFLGIDFSSTDIFEIKRIFNNEKYLEWIAHYSSNMEKLKIVIPNFKFSNTFEREFLKCTSKMQLSIIDEFIKAKNRNLVTPFFPDTKIIKDVTQENFDHKILELRVYNPVAIRVYFNDSDGVMTLISIEQKSNPNQNEDIKNAHTKFSKI